MVLFGSIAGISGAAALTKIFRSALHGVSPTDPAAFGTAAVILAVTALSASFFPAYRASKTDPTEILTSRL